MQSSERQGRATRQTDRQHRAIVRAVQALERALASPAPGRIEAWKRRIRYDLSQAVELLEKHRASAEREGGILVEMELILGRTYDIMRLQQDHATIVSEARDLLAALDEHAADPALTASEVRDRAAKLTAAIRAHQAVEADLIMEAFHRDIGVGD